MAINDKPIFDAIRLLTGPITPATFGQIKNAIQQWQATGDDKPLFDILRARDKDHKLSDYDVTTLKRALAAATAGDDQLCVVRKESRDMSPAAIESMANFESFRADAYPDPGSRDGNPWTIGFGSTGPDIRKGLVWTRRQALDRMTADIRRFEDGVERAIGNAPTSQQQFDAFVHFSYNIGVAAFANSTLLKKHRAGDYEGAAREFGKWVYNDKKIMNGLVRRRAHEEAIYRGQV